MNQVRTFLCSCGEARGMGVEKEERFLLPFPIRVQPRSMLCFYSQSSNFLLACFFHRILEVQAIVVAYMDYLIPTQEPLPIFFQHQNNINIILSPPSFPDSKRNRLICARGHAWVGGGEAKRSDGVSS